MKKLIAILTLSTVLTASAGDLYKIVHKDGSVTYTDTPQLGAVEIDMSKSNSATMPALNSGAGQLPAKRVTKAHPNYELNIVSPIDQETIRNNIGKVTVSGQISPIGNGKFELYLDGALAQTSTAPSFQLQNVVRGEHVIQIKFIHHTGKILASSKPSVFFMHQASVLINSN